MRSLRDYQVPVHGCDRGLANALPHSQEVGSTIDGSAIDDSYAFSTVDINECSSFTELLQKTVSSNLSHLTKRGW